jgi:hypothetical protein
MKKSKFLAVLGAAALTLSVAGVALAENLLDGQVGNTLGSFDEQCNDWNGGDIGTGQVGVHFVLNKPEAQTGHLTAAFSNPSSSVGPVANGDPQDANVLHFWVVITGDANTTIDSASTDVDGNNLVVSHVCFGAAATPTPTATPEESFNQSFAGETDAPSEPSTDAFGGSGTSGPAGGAWLLVVALGVLLASIVVLTPARAKGRR